MIPFGRLDRGAREALARAAQLADLGGYKSIWPAHIVAGCWAVKLRGQPQGAALPLSPATQAGFAYRVPRKGPITREVLLDAFRGR